MKKKLIAYAVLFAIAITSAQALFADDDSPVSLSLQIDAAYYPKSERITGEDHFAPITGPYSGLEGAITLNAGYTIPTPLGDNWLVSGANVYIGGGVELTPVSVRPKESIEFTPVPFLVFKAGGSLGLGWNVFGFEGLCVFDESTLSYQPLKTFEHPFYEVYGSGTFQFDTGAIIDGDWSHVVLQATYTTSYSGLAGLEEGTIYEWQASKNKARGLQYEFQGILAYQMPIPLKMAGVMFKTNGHSKGEDYGKFNATYNGAFATINISPLLQFVFTENDTLFCLFDFSSRRSFNTTYEKDGAALYLKNTGREWYFNRFAISFTHKFM